jgi:toxin ParE1/3/4
MLPLRITSPAEADLFDIWVAIAHDDQQRASSVLDRINGRFEQLATMPQSGQRCEHFGVGLRCSSVMKYVIYYHVTDVDLEIVRVVHGARDQQSLVK